MIKARKNKIIRLWLVHMCSEENEFFTGVDCELRSNDSDGRLSSSGFWADGRIV